MPIPRATGRNLGPRVGKVRKPGAAISYTSAWDGSALGLRLRGGVARDARPARRQGRQRGRDDAAAGRRPGARRVHDHDRGLRRLHGGRGTFPPASASRSRRRWRGSRSDAGKRLGDAEDPLLVSVRSGARESMPGMMDTVLNLGLNDDSVAGLAAAHRQRALCLGLLSALRADVRQRRPRHRGAALRGPDPAPRRTRSRGPRRHRARRRGAAPPRRRFQGPLRVPRRPARPAAGGGRRGLRLLDGRRGRSPTAASTGSPTAGARRSTCSRWCSATRARRSGSGVAFSRDEVTGGPTPSGDFLPNAQGEDVVSGVRTPRDIAELVGWLPEVNAQLLKILRTLERHYGDMQDTEFTVEEGRLYMLQTRNAKRPAQAAVRFAVDAVAEGLLEPERALMTIDAGGPGDAAAPDLRPRRRLRDPGRRGRRLSRGRQGRGRVRRADGDRGRGGGPRRDPRPLLHRGRRRRRLPRRQGHPHLRGGQGLACGAGRPGDGGAGGDRRRQPGDRRRGGRGADRRRGGAPGRRPDRDRRHRRGDHGGGRAAGGGGDERGLRDRPRLG